MLWVRAEACVSSKFISCMTWSKPLKIVDLKSDATGYFYLYNGFILA